jgi:transcriptional regulator with XRE-family HTH domain
MSIGETLAAARRGTGLTVTEVSQRTRIRETLVKNIERDDYSGCGGDFYTRGHIRAIARVVGTDPEPLIEEYDSARRAESAATSAEAPPLVTPGRTRPPQEPATGHAAVSRGFPIGRIGGWHEEHAPPAGHAPRAGHAPPAAYEPPGGHESPWLMPIRIRRRRSWPLLLGVALVVVLGLLGYYFVAGSGGSPAGAPAAGGQRTPTRSGESGAGGRAAQHARTVVVSLTAVRASLVEFTTPGGKYLFRADLPAGASKRWAFRYPVTMRLVDPAGVRLVVDGKNPLPHGSAARPVTLNLSPGRPATVASPASTPAPATTPSPAVPLTTPLSPASAAAFGVGGPGQGDNPQLAHLAIDGSRATAWTTDWYTSARFGNLYPGTGLLLDMGRPVTVTGAQISLGSAPGASFQLRVGSAPALADLPPVAHAAGASGVVRVRLTTPAHGRYVLIWFTRLPLSRDGNFQVSVRNVRLEGRA